MNIHDLEHGFTSHIGTSIKSIAEDPDSYDRQEMLTAIKEAIDEMAWYYTQTLLPAMKEIERLQRKEWELD